jgi:integrase
MDAALRHRRYRCLGDARNGFQDVLDTFGRQNLLTADVRQVRFNLSVVRKFLQATGTRSPHTIDRPTITDYLARLTDNPKTIRNHAGALSCFCGWLEDRGILPANPVRGIKLPRLRRLLPHYYNDQEFIQALEIAEKHDIYVEVCLALMTGLRQGELRISGWSWVDWSGRILKVPAIKSKSPRIVPLNEMALEALERQRKITGHLDFIFSGWESHSGKNLRNAPRNIKWWRRALRPLVEAIPAYACLPKGTVGRAWHMARHSFGTLMVRRNGGNILPDLQRMMGHENIQTTMIYVHVAEGYNPAIEKMNINSIMDR